MERTIKAMEVIPHATLEYDEGWQGVVGFVAAKNLSSATGQES